MMLFGEFVQMMLSLRRYVSVLDKASKSSNPSEVFEELLPLLKCKFFDVAESDLARIENIVNPPKVSPPVSRPPAAAAPLSTISPQSSAAPSLQPSAVLSPQSSAAPLSTISPQSSAAPSFQSSAAPSATFSHYAAAHAEAQRKQLKLLMMECDILKNERDVLKEMIQCSADEAEKEFSVQEAEIAYLRERLKAISVPDPTISK